MREIQIYCKNTSSYVDAPGGSTLLDIARQIGPAVMDMNPVCALVNNKTENLGFPVFGPKQVEYLDCFTRAGMSTCARCA